MANSYLKEFRSVIGGRQIQQILNVLNTQRNAGQIRNLDEFTSRLESLTRDLASTTLSPSLRLYLGKIADITSQEEFNFMLERVEDDLKAAFEEALNIDEVQQSHEILIRDIILKGLKEAVNELEAKISLHMFLASNNDGFSTAIFSTFQESKDTRMSRTNSYQIVFTDPRDNVPFATNEDAYISLVGERLLLGTKSTTSHPIGKVEQLFDVSTPQSSLVTSPGNVKLSNMIDGQKGTFWIQSIFSKVTLPCIRTKLTLDLSSLKEISYLEIEPAANNPLILETIYYLNSSGELTELISPNLQFTSPFNILLPKVTTTQLTLVFKNEHFWTSQFELQSTTLQQMQTMEPMGGLTPKVSNLDKVLSSTISSPKMRRAIGVTKEVASSTKTRLGFNPNQSLTPQQDSPPMSFTDLLKLRGG